MRITHALLAGLLAFAPAVAAAQPAGAPARPVDAAQVSDGELELATRFITLADLQTVVMSGVRVMLDQQLESSPELVPYRGVLEDWIRGVFASDDATAAFARVYAESFTEQELRDMIAFFESPTGRRMVAEQENLSLAGERIGEELARAHTGDLVARLTAAMEDGGSPRKGRPVKP